MTSIFVALLKILPLKLVSRITGRVTKWKLPRFILQPFFRWYVRFYQVNLEESEGKPEDYKTINEFFTRRLIKGARVIDKGAKSVVSPVDGTILISGPIDNGLVWQIKGRYSRLEDIVTMGTYRKRFIGGDYVIIYLSPRDYHRIHSPITGRITGYSYNSGKLFPVNSFAVHNIDSLFSVNERLTTYLENSDKVCAVVKVGATNVGSIRVVYDDNLRTNLAFQKDKSELYMEKKSLKKGQELGMFEMGSTVMLLFEKGMVKLNLLTPQTKVKYGEAIGQIKG